MAGKATKKGYVYILVSKNCKYIKIGGTAYAPLKRIKEINTTEPYKSLGVWTLSDFREVADWRKVEYQLHYVFRSKLVKKVTGQRSYLAFLRSRLQRNLMVLMSL